MTLIVENSIKKIQYLSKKKLENGDKELNIQKLKN